MPQADLTHRPRHDRLATGPAPFVPDGDDAPVEKEGGDYGAGLIRGMAVITRGEALGHGMWIDKTTLKQTADAMNVGKGVKSRFTHPSASGDGMGKHLGRAKNATLDGDIVRGDLHFFKAAHAGPDGDLAGHVMDLADEDGEAFGNSIAFDHDIEAENAFIEEHGGKVIDAEFGLYDLTEFKSPDPKNVDNLFHVRIRELRAVDVVDEPAANPSGLFLRGQEIPTEADALCAYAFGLTDDRPVSTVLGIDPDRLRGFAGRFLSSRGLTVATKGDGDMPTVLDSKKTTKPATKPANPPAEPITAPESAPETPVVPSPEPDPNAPHPPETFPVIPPPGTHPQTPQTPPGPAPVVPVTDTPADEKAAALSAVRAEFSRFVALDPEKGPEWFNAGKTYEEALALSNEKLKAERAELQGRLGAVNRGEKDPVTFSAGDAPNPKDTEPRAGLNAGQSRYAAGLLLPGRN